MQDAGERVYFRVASRPDSCRRAPRSVVVCVMSRPYEPGALPFANSAALYRDLGVRAPTIFREAPDLGVVELEDLGDGLLQRAALAGDPATGVLYQDAVGIIARIQREGARIESSDDRARYGAFAMHLDERLFRFELRFFVEHFLVGYSGARVDGGAAGELDSLLHRLAKEAASGPPVLCHRDYHSRNLIAVPRGSEDTPELFVIDHQDSRIGPRGYDLMSLARDPYVATASPPDTAAGVERSSWTLPFSERELIACWNEAVGRKESPAALAEEFDAVALQRNLKALGTYGFQVDKRRNLVYRGFIRPTLAFVRENLERHRARRERRELLTLLADLVDLA